MSDSPLIHFLMTYFVLYDPLSGQDLIEMICKVEYLGVC